jgi:hypothetical protein
VKKNAKVPREVILKVAEVEDIIESLKAARSVRDLTGDQRRQLQETHDELVQFLDHTDNGMISLPVSMVVYIMRCAIMTQFWISEMLTELSVVTTNDQ